MMKMRIWYGLVSAIAVITIIACIFFQFEILKYFLAVILIVYGTTEIIRGVYMLKSSNGQYTSLSK